MPALVMFAIHVNPPVGYQNDYSKALSSFLPGPEIRNCGQVVVRFCREVTAFHHFLDTSLLVDRQSSILPEPGRGTPVTLYRLRETIRLEIPVVSLKGNYIGVGYYNHKIVHMT